MNAPTQAAYAALIAAAHTEASKIATPTHTTATGVQA